MHLTFLGTAGSWPTKERSASAIALDLERELVLLDCGEGTQRQFFQSPQSFMRVRRIFITHFHGDHFLGLPGLIQSMCLNHRSAPLDIYGPEDAKEIVDRALHLGYFTLRFPVTIHALAPGATVELDGYTVRTARADHPVPALAFRLEEGAKRGRFDGEHARSLGIRGPDFGRLEAGDSVRVGDRLIRPDEVMGPPGRAGRSSTPATARPPRRSASSRKARRSSSTRRPPRPISKWRRTDGATPRPGRPRSSRGPRASAASS